MAAITRAFLPPFFVHSFKYTARILARPSQTTQRARTVSKYARLQPVFPDTPDENLFEHFTEEYETLEDVIASTQVEKAYPCDVLATAATSGDLVLGESLLQEYTTAKIDIVHRPVYANLALASLQHGDINSMSKWLALVPSAHAKYGVQHPANDEGIVRLLNINGMRFDRMMQLLHLYCLKGWSGRVPEQIVGTLAGYIPTDQFLRMFAEIITVREKAVGNSVDERALLVRLRCLAIQRLAERNNPEAAWHLLREDFDAVLERDPNVAATVYQAAKRTGSSIGALLRQIQNDRSLNFLSETTSRNHARLDSRTLTTLALRVESLGGRVSRYGNKGLVQQVIATLRTLKSLLVSPRIKPDPKAIAYLLLALTKTRSSHDFARLFRRRIARLGAAEDQDFWGTVEFELLCSQDDSHSAVHYYRHVFNPHGSPSFLRNSIVSLHWEQWLSKPPPLSPPHPPSRLNPSYAARLAIWKAAITLSLKAPDAEVRGLFSNLLTTDNVGPVTYDTTHFRGLFQDFLNVFDDSMRSRRAAFSNVHTRVRFFELFLKKATDVEPAFCAEIMAEMQQRDVLLDHRVWFVYSKHKVLNGEFDFILKLVLLLEEDSGRPDFSPKALQNDMANGKKLGGTNGAEHVYMPHKVFSAYTYAFKLLLDADAYEEALKLHAKIHSAGYSAGSSVSFDRLTYTLMDRLRLRIKKARPRNKVDMVKLKFNLNPRL